MSKFNVGDRVRAQDNNGWQDWLEPFEFTIAEVHEEVWPVPATWYRGYDAVLNGEPYLYYDDVLLEDYYNAEDVVPGDTHGVWEDNLELVEVNAA